MEKKTSPKNRRLGMIIAIMLIASAGVCVAILSLAGNARDAQQNEQLQNDLHEQAVIYTQPQQTAAPVLTEAESPLAKYARQPDKLVDFDELHKTNEDIYAWITVPGTKIDYPVLFAAKGDDRYLTHDAQGNVSKYGAIYTDGYNSMDFSDPVTVVYGHNMKDGSMFASLHEFENGDFFDANRTILVYTGNVMLQYEIFAAYKTDNTHLLYAYDFADPAVFADYMQNVFAIRDMSAKLRECKWDAESRVITLATCVKGEDAARYIVQGVLVPND